MAFVFLLTDLFDVRAEGNPTRLQRFEILVEKIIDEPFEDDDDD